MKLRLLLATALLASLILPVVGAAPPQPQPPVWACTTLHVGPHCGNGAIVCYGSPTSVPFCVKNPCGPDFAYCFAIQDPAATQCTEFVGTGAAGAGCTVDGRPVGPVATCDTCLVLFYVACTEGTEGVRCWDNGGLIAWP
jgi:hypothetical protein